MRSNSYSFTHAIVRHPSRSILDGLRAVDTGNPDFYLFTLQHSHYVETLVSTGAKVLELAAEEAFPDSVFVEDVALCLAKGAVVMRPGAPSRFGEASLIKTVLSQFYKNVLTIEGPGFIEGGDILTTEREILVGLSSRTNSEGIEELKRLVSRWDYSVRVVNTPPEILHFKTDCSLLDEETILSTPRLAATGCFAKYRVIQTEIGEEACANAIRFNNLVIMPDGFPRTAEHLFSLGYNIRLVGNSEAAKLDGGMSCLSLRFTAP